MLEDSNQIYTIISIIGSVCGGTWWISRKLQCAQQAAETALIVANKVEQWVDRELRRSQETHNTLFRKIENIYLFLLKQADLNKSI